MTKQCFFGGVELSPLCIIYFIWSAESKKLKIVIPDGHHQVLRSHFSYLISTLENVTFGKVKLLCDDLRWNSCLRSFSMFALRLWVICWSITHCSALPDSASFNDLHLPLNVSNVNIHSLCFACIFWPLAPM